MTTKDKLNKILKDIADLQQYVTESLDLHKSLVKDNQQDDQLKDTKKDAEDFLSKIRLKLGDIDCSIDNYITPKNNYVSVNNTVNDNTEVKSESTIGKIKIKDINTLLDPKVLEKKNKGIYLNNTAIILSDSEEENSTQLNNNKSPVVVKKITSSVKKIFNNINKKKNIRQCNNKRDNRDLLKTNRLKVLDSSSSDDEQLNIIRDKTANNKQTAPLQKEIVSDKKFGWKCYIPLSRYSAKELKTRYINNMEVTQINNLTDIKDIKRKRKRSKNSTSSSDVEEQNKKKCTKTSSKRSSSSSSNSSSSSSSSSSSTSSSSSKSNKSTEDNHLMATTKTPNNDVHKDIKMQANLLECIPSDRGTSDDDNDDGKQIEKDLSNKNDKETKEKNNRDAMDCDENKEDSDKEDELNESNDTAANSEHVDNNSNSESDDDNKSDDSKANDSKSVEEGKDVDKEDEDKSDEDRDGEGKNGEENDDTGKGDKGSDDDGNGDKEKDDKGNGDESKDDEDGDDESKDGEDKDQKKEKANWRKDKLLNEKIDLSDSEDNFKSYLRKNEKEKAKEADNVKSNKKKSRNILRSDSEESGSSDSNSKDKSASTSTSASSESEKEEASDKEKKKRRRRVQNIKDSSDDEDEKATRKQIRKVMHNDSLSQRTKQAEKEEVERKERIAERQKRYNNIFEKDDLQNDTVDKVVLDFDEETNEELLSVHKSIVKHLKPHQAKGIQFMFDACFESLKHLKKNDGSGCILAHCMGLGKTLQVIALCHTLLTNLSTTNINKIMVVCPLNTVLNWVAEFRKWLPKNHNVDVYDLIAYKKMYERSYKVTEWMNDGGVLIIGYDMFRNLTNNSNKRINKNIRKSFHQALVEPGPDLVICDEGHLLKNEKSSISIAMNKIKTLRRVVLTGTPLQNNLKEYYCMVHFVRPNLLGTYKEYMNRFVNPITNGQYTDSTLHDISLMRKRSHVLHKMLDGIVQRRDYSVLAPFLPPKHEYVLFVKLTDLQMKLYEYYLNEKSQSACVSRAARLFSDFQEFQRICTHPRVLLNKSVDVKIAREKKWSDEESEGSLRDFIDDGSEAESTSSSNSRCSNNSEAEVISKTKRITRSNKCNIQKEDEEVEEVTYNKDDPCEWWRQFCTDADLDDISHGAKLKLLFDILKQCELIGDKLLIFSQSLYSLDVIEYFLSKIDEATQNNENGHLNSFSGSWALGLDYFRLDGSSSCDNRALWCKLFNNPNNTRARLFLISTKAGGLGINLVAANRVIIFDVSWNPSHDIQSIYRVYRFGQTKPSYIYRFVTMGTMEMKVYERQVTKQAISKRVIDEQQIDRHYNQHDLQELYKYEPCPSDRPVPLVPRDMMLAELLQDETRFIFKYHEHQTLLENKEDEELDEEERKAAWEEYENEKKSRTSTSGFLNRIPIPTIMLGMRRVLLQRNPALTKEDLDLLLPDAYAMLTQQMANNDYSFYNKILEAIRMMTLTPEQKRVQEYMRLQQQQAFALQLQQMYNAMPNNLNQMYMQQFNNRNAAHASSSRSANVLSEVIEINDEP